MKVIDPGVTDKRVLLNEQRVLLGAGGDAAPGQHAQPRRSRRLGLRADARNADQERPTPAASKAFISIVGHITIDELRDSLDHTSMANGYANRFLFACVRPQQGTAARRRRCRPERADRADAGRRRHRPRGRARHHERQRQGSCGARSTRNCRRDSRACWAPSRRARRRRRCGWR